MMPQANPYSWRKPVEHDHQFFDQGDIIKDILQCLDRGESCSIIGGVGMGKTSILIKIKEMFSSADQPTQFRFIPIYFKPDLRESDSLRTIYQQLINRTISQTRAWLGNCVVNAQEVVSDYLDFLPRLKEHHGSTTPGEDRRAFEEDLGEIIEAIRHAVANAKLLFLLDDMYRIEDKDIKGTLFGHCFELLDEENLDKEKLRSHLAFIITCYKCHREQFISRRPDVATGPIRDPIEPIYLHVFDRADAEQVMQHPFKDTLDLELTNAVANKIYNFIGGYPRLLQSTMKDLWNDAKKGKSISIPYVESCTENWVKRHLGICGWIDEMISDSENEMLRPVLDRLVQGGSCQRTTLARLLRFSSVSNSLYGYNLRDALWTLGSWGVVRKVRKDEYDISGELFRDWFERPHTHLDESNRRGTMNEPQERAVQFEDQLRDLLSLVNRKDFADLYDGDVDQTKALLEEHLATLRTDMQQMRDLEKKIIFHPDAAFNNAKRALILDIENIGVKLETKINPKFESIASQLVEKAKRAEAGDEGLFLRAVEAFNEAIAIVAAPVAKAAALAMSIKTLMDFFQAMPK